MLCCNVLLIYFIFLSHVNFQTIRAMELIIHDKLDSMRSKHLPPIKRGGEIDIYMTSSGQQEKTLFYEKKKTNKNKTKY